MTLTFHNVRSIRFILAYRIATDQGANESKESVPICGSKQTEVRKEKALAGFEPTGHYGSHIQPELVNPIYAAGNSENHMNH